MTTRLAPAMLLLALFTPTPPERPLDGPGGRSYAHERVIGTRLGSGAEEVYLFEPADPSPERAPVVVFGHGWGGMGPNYYGAWIEHIVRRGSIVIFPRYQADLRTPVRDFTENALRATRRALEELRAPGHVAPDGRGLAFVGHSMGALIVANLASRAATGDLPPPLALMAVTPGKTWPEGTPIAFPLEDLSGLPPSLLLLAVDDDFVLEIDARKIYEGATGVPPSNKDYVRMFSDDYGTPDLVADHRAPTAPFALVDGGGSETTIDRVTDFLDFFGTWSSSMRRSTPSIAGCTGNTPSGTRRSSGSWAGGATERPCASWW